jgi:dipeptidyl aminopeptidase/acylaminoacyl peptidase
VPLPGLLSLFGLTWNGRANLLALQVRTDTGEEVVWTIKPTGEDRRRVYGGSVSSACDSPAVDALYLFVDQRLLRVPLTIATTDAPDVLMSGLAPTDSEARTCSVSADGRRMLHVRRTAYANLWQLDLASPNAQPRRLTEGTAKDGTPAISPDGRWIAFTGPPDGIWRMPVAGGDKVQLAVGMTPAWSPDGRRLAWVSNDGGAQRLWVGDTDGRHAKEISSSGMNRSVLTWFDENRLGWPLRSGNYRIRDLSTGREESLLTNEPLSYVFAAQLSLQRDRVAIFRLNQSGFGLSTVSLVDRAEHFLVPNLVPVGWSPDAEWIYAHQTSSPTIVKVSTRSREVRPVSTFPVGRLEEFHACSVAPDGTALVCSLTEATTDAWLIENFDPQAVGSKR